MPTPLSSEEKAYLRILWDWKVRRYGDPDGSGDYYRFPDPIDIVPWFLIEYTLDVAGYPPELYGDACDRLLDLQFIALSFVHDPCPRPGQWRLPNGTLLRGEFVHWWCNPQELSEGVFPKYATVDCHPVSNNFRFLDSDYVRLTVHDADKPPAWIMKLAQPELYLLVGDWWAPVVWHGSGHPCPECGAGLTRWPGPQLHPDLDWEEDYCPQCRKSVQPQWGTYGYYLTKKGERHARELALGRPGFDPFSARDAVVDRATAIAPAQSGNSIPTSLPTRELGRTLDSLREIIARLGRDAKPDAVIAEAHLRKAEGRRALRTLESTGEYAGFARPTPAKYKRD